MSGNGSLPRGGAGQIIIGNLQDELFIRGLTFTYDGRFTFSADEVKRFVIDPTACTCAQITFLPLVYSATQGPVTADIYTGTDADDDGTVLTPVNRRETYQEINPTGLVLRLNPTVNDIGVKLPLSGLVPATGTSPGNASGSESAQSSPFEIAGSVKKTLEVTNHGGNDALVFIGATWQEIPVGF